MLFTLTASCVRSLLVPDGKGKAPSIKLADLPAFTKEKLGLSGINMTTDLLVGADRAKLEMLKERADKAACSCLLLIEHAPSLLASSAQEEFQPAMERATRVLQAARFLGCNAASFRLAADNSELSFKLAVERLKKLMEQAEKLDLNVLIAPNPGLTVEPDKLTELIKKVGGFRIGTFPDFQLAAAQKDPSLFLRRIVPYASAVSASTMDFKPVGKPAGKGKKKAEVLPEDEEVEHAGFDMQPLIDAIEAVGYDGNLAIDYRGPGDPVQGVLRSRKLLESFWAIPASLEDFVEEDLDAAAAAEPDEEPLKEEE
jgi:sugar phosphate isomerase/epimerase